MNDSDVNVSLIVEGGALNIAETGVLQGRLEASEGKKICCEKICIYIPVGNGEESLFFNDGGVKIESDQTDMYQFGITTEDENKVMLELSTPDRGQRALSKPIEFTITGRVNMRMGQATVDYVYYCKDQAESKFGKMSKEFTFEKNKADLYLQNFLAFDPEGGSEAVTCFRPKAPIYFSWEGNGTSYELYAPVDGKMKPLIQTGQKYYLYRDGIDMDSTFLLKAVKTQNAVTDINGTREVYALLTLTTDGPSYREVVIREKLSGKESAVEMMGTAMEVLTDKTPNYKTFVPKTDGILAGYICVTSYQETSSAMLRATVYGDGQEEECSVEDTAYSVKINTDAGEMEMRNNASVLLPVAQGKTVNLYWTMTKPEQSELKKNYDLKWYFFPLGNGDFQLS